MSRSHRERRWPLRRLQTAEILSQLPDYYLALVAGECWGSAGGAQAGLPGLPVRGGKMNQRLVGGEVDSVRARFPVRLNKSRQTLAPIQAPLPKGSRRTSGKRPTHSRLFGSFIPLSNFYVNLSYYA